MHLYLILKEIIQKINKILARFLWAGKIIAKKYHLVCFSSIERPIQSGGWGILDKECFNISLVTKKNWRALYGTDIWQNGMKRKYFCHFDST